MDARALALRRTSRTARWRTSGENLLLVLLVMALPTQELGPPANPGRFKAIAGATSKGLEIALNVALRTMQRAPQAASHILHKTLATRPRPEPLGAHLVWQAWPSNCRSQQSLC